AGAAGPGLFLALLAGSSACRDIDALVPIQDPTPSCAPQRDAVVACTLDGDTVDLDTCGEGERVRFLGVAAPEIAHEPEPAECWGDAAASWVDERLTGRIVTLEFDAECTDIYGRTLAWLWVEGDAGDRLADDLREFDDFSTYFADDGSFRVLFNDLVIRAGQARLYDEGFAQDVRYYERLQQSEDLAAIEGRGLWGACDG
ncbi:MAG: hypothetical protein D6798_14420, partial [Deltaproteobacteria bacterium]